MSNQRPRTKRHLPPVFLRLAGILLILMQANAIQAKDIAAAGYGFPLTNPFEATIARTPNALRPRLPDDASIEQLDYSLSLNPQREERLPPNFWAVKKLRYRLARQAGPAPLIFIISGTGGRYDAGENEFLKKWFYKAGFHVVQLSSPTSFDFIASASRLATPGYSPEDARDLYRVMEAIQGAHADLPVQGYYLTGYSLGALDAAFVSHLDEGQHRFDFRKVLLINPPVNLYTSINNLDRMVQTRVTGIDDHTTFYQVILGKLARFLNQRGYIDINEAMLYDFQQSRERLSNDQMAMLIGMVFRFTATDIVYTSDLINHRGLISPPDMRLTEGTSLTPFYERALRCDFNCYLHKQLLPMWRSHFKGKDFQQLVHQASLYALRDYLRDSPKISVMHNADDPILGPGDIGFLRATFGDRLTLFPYGGHLGNINYSVNNQTMLEDLK